MFHFKLRFNNNPLRLAMKYSMDLTIFIVFKKRSNGIGFAWARAGEPEIPEPYDLAGTGAILFFLQEPEHFKRLEWSRGWSRSWYKLVRLQAPAAFKKFVKNNDFW